MNSESWFSIFSLLWPFLLLLATYAIGAWIERRHFRSVLERENALRQFPVMTLKTLPANWQVASAHLVTGNVVISLDYFKRFIAALRGIVGGRVKSYEPLLERARREALLRMTEEARQVGFDAVINVRLETSRLASSRGDGEGTAGIELMAFGTGIRLARSEST